MTLRFAQLDRANLRRLRPGQSITEHGITARRSASGDLRWSVNITVDGTRIHRHLGRESEGVTRSTCETLIETKRTEAREGRLNLPSGRKTWLGMREGAERYLSRLEETGGKNIARKRRHLDRRLVPHFGNERLERLTSFAIAKYVKRRGDEGAAPASINRELATLSHLLTCAAEWRWIPARPCRIKLQREGAGRIIVLNDEEADNLLRAAVADADPYCWLFVAFGLQTAMRHSEILATRFDQVDFDKLRLHVPAAKAGEREQPITPELAGMLKREREMAQDPAGWIFPALRPKLAKAGHRTRMDRPYARAVIAAGLEPNLVTPHVMRHTGITNLVKAGVDIPTIMKISGHNTVAMVLRYTHIHGRHIDQGIAALGRTVPEPRENQTANAATPKLHQRSLKSA